MMKAVTVYQVDAFTNRKFKGNPAGVVLQADGLSEGEMLDIAKELNNSETAFVFPPVSADNDVWLRFFYTLNRGPYLRTCHHRGPLCQGR
jgi:PhzF family phenazine biosynthesis protein